MDLQRFLGKTIKEFAEKTTIFWKPIRVFLLDDKNDNTGKFMVSAYTAKQILLQFPAAATAKIVHAENYYGETILRIITT